MYINYLIIMLIQKQKQITFEIVKTRIFDTFSIIIQETYTESQNIFILFIFEKIIQVLLEFTILFQPQLLQIWHSNNINNAIILFTMLNPITYINNNIQIYIISLVFIFLICLALLILFVLIACKTIEKSIFYRLVMILVRLLKLFTIPIYHIICYSINNSNPFNSMTIQILCLIFGILLTFILGINIKFYFSPLRKNNLYHKINTDFQFYEFLTNIFKIMLVNRYDFHFSLIGIFLTIQISKNMLIKKSYQTFSVQILNKMCSYCNLITYVAIIVTLFNNNYDTIFYFWLIAIILILLTILSKIFSENILIMDIDDCKQITQDKIFNLIQINEQMQKAQQQIFFYFYFGYVVNHTQKCSKDTCYLKINEKKIFSEIEITQNFNRKNVVDHFNNFVIELIEYHSQISQEFSILNYIILFETNRIEKLTNLERHVSSLGYEFIIYHIKKIIKSEKLSNDYQITEQNFKQSRLMFFKQFSAVIQEIKFFMNQLKQKKTRLEIVEKTGYKIYLQIQSLKLLFNKILKNDRVDFKIIEFYIEFLLNFLKQKTEVHQLIQKIMRKSCIKYDDYNVEDTSIPTFQINVKQFKIENVNMQVIKIFNYHKIEMIEKKIQNFIFPEIVETQQDFNRIFKELSTENTYCFGKNRKNQYFPLKLKSRIKQYSNTKKYFLELHQLKKLKNQAYILLNQKFQPMLYSQRQLKVSNNHSTIIIQQIFNTLIKPNILLLQRNLKMELQNGDIFPNQISLLKTINPQCFIINIKIKITPKNYAIQIIQPRINKVFFTISKLENSIKPYFIGSKQQSCNKYKSSQLCKYEQKLSKTNNGSAFIKVNYQKGIKSYRVIGDNLINIQLQDKECNFQIFINKKQAYQNTQIRNNIIIKILNYAIFILLIFYLVITIYFAFNKFTNLSTLNTVYTNYNMIQAYSLKFFRMIAILRDSLLFNNTSWSNPLLNTFYDLQYSQYLQRGKLFSNTQYNMTLDGLILYQDLQNLCNNLNTLIFKMGIQNNNYLASQVVGIASTIISSAMYSQKMIVKSNVNNTLNNIFISTIQLFVSYILISIGFFLLLFVIDIFQIFKRKQLLIDFRNMSDYQIESFIERLQRFEYLLTLNEKNEELQVLGALKQQVDYQKRQYPKDYQTKLIKSKSYVLFIVVLLIIIFGIFTYMTTLTSTYIKDSSTQLQTNSKLANIYIQYLQLSVNISKKINTTIFAEMFDSLEYLEMNKWDYPYDINFTNFLNSVMFANSCSILPNYIQNFSCSTYKLNTPITYPFQQGLIYYLHTMHFSLNENISQCIPSTGINGYPFYIIFGYILNETLREWKIQNLIIIDYEISFLVLNIIVLIILNLVFVFTYYDNLNKEQKIKLIGKIFMKEESNNQNIKKVPEQSQMH